MAAQNKPSLSRDKLISSAGTKTRNLTLDEALLVQRPFLVELKKKMSLDGLSPTQLAKKLDIAYSYLVALTSGARMIANAERQRIEKFADYLDVPVAQIYIWGGLLMPKDFIVHTNLDKALDNIFSIMGSDNTLTGILPTPDEWADGNEFSERSKLLIAQLYELYSNRMMLERAQLTSDKRNVKIPKHILDRD